MLGIQLITTKHAKEVEKDYPWGREKSITSIKITQKWQRRQTGPGH